MVLVQLLAALGLPIAQAQNFQNLGFERARVPVVPSGEFGHLVPVEEAIPGWSVWLGADPQTHILHNNFTLGAPSAVILGPQWPSQSIIEGSFTLRLRTGLGFPPAPDPGPGFAVDVSLLQTGLIPLEAQSVRFKAEVFPRAAPITLRLDGQEVLLLAMETTQNRILFGGDVSAFAGRTAELRLTAIASVLGPTDFRLDSFSFSSEPVPEPGALTLWMAGGASLALWAWRRRTDP